MRRVRRFASGVFLGLVLETLPLAVVNFCQKKLRRKRFLKTNGEQQPGKPLITIYFIST